MAKCEGTVPAGTKIDRSMSEFIDREAEKLGVSRAETIRRIFDGFRDSHDGEIQCPNCQTTVIMKL